jgi:predicted transcriptional regulator of viral defense system
LVSDPTRTLLDLIAEPKLGGGIRGVTDMLNEYLKSEHKHFELLIEYAKRLNNGAAFKRLGFLLERYIPEEKQIIEACKMYLTKGIVKLDPNLEADTLITKWRLWVLKGWKE